MSGPERDAGSEPPEKPEREQIPDYEIDLTGVVRQTDSLIDVIIDAIVEAGSEGEVPEWGARVMARYLANDMKSRTSALHHFAATGNLAHEVVAQELADLWRDHGHLEFVAEVINRLGTYVVAVQRTEAKRPGPEYSDEVQALIVELGPAFAAFLTLPDVSGTDLTHLFHESYYSTYASLEEIAQHVAETHEVWQLLDDASLDHLASPDPALLLKLARERWDIVEHDGRYYLFEK